MNYTKTLYPNIDKIHGFERKYGNIKKMDDYISLVNIYEMFIKNNSKFDEKKFDAVFAGYSFRSVAEALNNYDNWETREEVKKDLQDVIKLIELYRDNTIMYITDEEFCYTVAQTAELFDIKEGYLTRNLIENFDYFNICNYVRYAIKYSFSDMFDKDFLNKKQFLSTASIENFIRKHIKYSSYRNKIVLDFTEVEESKLYEKFKTKKDIEKAINRVIEDLDLEFVPDTSKIKKRDLPVYELPDELVDFIMQGTFKMKAMATLKEKYRAEAQEQLEETKGKAPDIAKAEIELKKIINNVVKKTMDKLTGGVNEDLISKGNMPLYSLTNEIVNSILEENHNNKAIKALEVIQKAKRDEINKEDSTRNYTLKSYNDHQVYVNHLNKMDFARLVFTDVIVYNGQFKREQSKNIVRYLARATHLTNKASENSYTIYNKTYRGLAKKLINKKVEEGISEYNPTEEEIMDYIKKTIYGRLVDSSFVLKKTR